MSAKSASPAATLRREVITGRGGLLVVEVSGGKWPGHLLIGEVLWLKIDALAREPLIDAGESEP